MLWSSLLVGLRGMPSENRVRAFTQSFSVDCGGVITVCVGLGIAWFDSVVCGLWISRMVGVTAYDSPRINFFLSILSYLGVLGVEDLAMRLGKSDS